MTFSIFLLRYSKVTEMSIKSGFENGNSTFSMDKLEKKHYICASLLHTSIGLYVKYLNSSKKGCDWRKFKKDLMKRKREMSYTKK